MKDKNNAIIEFEKMIEQSWTYEKMTKQEKDQWKKVLNSIQTTKATKGNFIQRWEILQSLYNSYLLALNYTWNWREEKNNLPF